MYNMFVYVQHQIFLWQIKIKPLREYKCCNLISIDGHSLQPIFRQCRPTYNWCVKVKVFETIIFLSIGLQSALEEIEIPGPPPEEPSYSTDNIGDLICFDFETTSLGIYT